MDWAQQQWVVDHQQIRSPFEGSIHRSHDRIDRKSNADDAAPWISGDQANRVPRLGQVRRKHFVEDRRHLLEARP
jgi:hypothetical protein